MLILTDCRVISDAAVFFSSMLRVATVAYQSKAYNWFAFSCLVKTKYLLLPNFLVSPVYYFNGEAFVVDYSPPIYNDGRREVVIILLCYSGKTNLFANGTH